MYKYKGALYSLPFKEFEALLMMAIRSRLFLNQQKFGRLSLSAMILISCQFRSIFQNEEPKRLSEARKYCGIHVRAIQRKPFFIPSYIII